MLQGIEPPSVTSGFPVVQTPGYSHLNTADKSGVRRARLGLTESGDAGTVSCADITPQDLDGNPCPVRQSGW